MASGVKTEGSPITHTKMACVVRLNTLYVKGCYGGGFHGKAIALKFTG